MTDPRRPHRRSYGAAIYATLLVALILFALVPIVLAVAEGR